MITNIVNQGHQGRVTAAKGEKSRCRKKSKTRCFSSLRFASKKGRWYDQTHCKSDTANKNQCIMRCRDASYESLVVDFISNFNQSFRYRGLTYIQRRTKLMGPEIPCSRLYLVFKFWFTQTFRYWGLTCIHSYLNVCSFKCKKTSDGQMLVMFRPLPKLT